MYKSCSRCGKVHDTRFRCTAGQIKRVKDNEHKLRSTYAWTLKSLEIREKSNYLCEVCREQGIYKYDDVEVHHITKVKENEQELLNDFNLVTLCKEHHRQADEGLIDADYLRSLAKRRETAFWDGR